MVREILRRRFCEVQCILPEGRRYFLDSRVYLLVWLTSVWCDDHQYRITSAWLLTKHGRAINCIDLPLTQLYILMMKTTWKSFSKRDHL